MPNLGKLEDIADYMIGGENGEGYVTDATSGSELESDNEIEVVGSTTRKVLSAKARLQPPRTMSSQKKRKTMWSAVQ